MKSTPEDILRAGYVFRTHEQSHPARQPKAGLRAAGIVCGDHGINFSRLERAPGKLGFDPIGERANGDEFTVRHRDLA
jgi:hypothetical protein